MSSSPQSSEDCPSGQLPKPVVTVQRINERWIVRGRLRESARHYLEYLRLTDPPRLLESCQIALHLVHDRDAQHDPKPLFYAGVFSLATSREIHRFLSEHILTHAVCRQVQGEQGAVPPLPETTLQLSRRIAKKVARAIHTRSRKSLDLESLRRPASPHSR